MGHPKIFINVDKPQICWCTYCGLPYVGYRSDAWRRNVLMILYRPTHITRSSWNHNRLTRIPCIHQTIRTRLKCRILQVGKDKFRAIIPSYEARSKQRLSTRNHLPKDKIIARRKNCTYMINDKGNPMCTEDECQCLRWSSVMSLSFTITSKLRLTDERHP